MLVQLYNNFNRTPYIAYVDLNFPFSIATKVYYPHTRNEMNACLLSAAPFYAYVRKKKPDLRAVKIIIPINKMSRDSVKDRSIIDLILKRYPKEVVLHVVLAGNNVRRHKQREKKE